MYNLCSRIPKGQVSSYGAMARELCSAPRAVGQALRNNPFPPKVPCHRVVAMNRKMGGFGGDNDPHGAKIQRKIQMLKAEGVLFDEDGTVNEASMLTSFDGIP